LTLTAQRFTIERVGAPQNVLNWINNSLGRTHGNGHCVIYINHYLTEFWSITTAGKGVDSAYQVFDMAFPTGWQKISHSEGFIPQPGDIAVWGQNWYPGAAHGHVGVVVDGSTANQVVVYDQWTTSGGVVKSTYTHANRINFLGVIRPMYP
jgi:hypothetical protein